MDSTGSIGDDNTFESVTSGDAASLTGQATAIPYIRPTTHRDLDAPAALTTTTTTGVEAEADYQTRRDVLPINSTTAGYSPTHIQLQQQQAPMIMVPQQQAVYAPLSPVLEMEAAPRKYCPFWIHGTCRFGSNCRNLHGTQVTLPLLTSTRNTELQERLSGAASFQGIAPVPVLTTGTGTGTDTAVAQDSSAQEIEYRRQLEMQQRQMQPQPMMTETQYYALMLLDMLNTANTAWVIMILICFVKIHLIILVLIPICVCVYVFINSC